MVITESLVPEDYVSRESDLSSAASDHSTKNDAPEQDQIIRATANTTQDDTSTALNGQSEKIATDVNSGKEPSAEEPPSKQASCVQSASQQTSNNNEGIATEESVIEETNLDTKTTSILSDQDLIAQAEEYVQQERLLDGARSLRKVTDESLLDEKHLRVLQKAQHVEAAVVDLTSSPDDGWTKQGESHGNYDTIVYFKVDDATRLTARIETPIEPSLLVPLLSVFNESELYGSGLPRFKQLGVSRSIKLRQTGRANQIIAVNCYMPWPLADREAIIEATAVDDIHENHHIVVKMETRYTGEENGLIPPPEGNTVRIDFNGGILFRKCPENHPAFRKSKHPHHDGPMVLVCMTMFVDAHVKFVPQSLINFVTRTVIGATWNGILEVAEGIRDGKRRQHAKAIESKKELYEWIEQRVEVMLDGMEKVNGEERTQLNE